MGILGIYLKFNVFMGSEFETSDCEERVQNKERFRQSN